MSCACLVFSDPRRGSLRIVVALTVALFAPYGLGFTATSAARRRALHLSDAICTNFGRRGLRGPELAKSCSPKRTSQNRCKVKKFAAAVPAAGVRTLFPKALSAWLFPSGLPVRAIGVGSAVLLCLMFRSTRIVRQGDVAILERLGRFNRQLNPGLHFLIPSIDRIRTRMSMRERVLDIPPQRCITSDNAPLEADAVVYWRVVDPVKAVYEVEDLVSAIQNLVLTHIRAEIGGLTLDETFNTRARINKVLLEELDEATRPWGIKITRVELRDIVPNPEILNAMEMQMAAERTKRALISRSEGEKQARLNEALGNAEAAKLEAHGKKVATICAAEAEKERQMHEAEGAAESFRLLLSAAGGDADRAAQLQLLKAYINAQCELAASPNAKVVLFPSSEDWVAKASGMLALLSSAGSPGSGKTTKQSENSGGQSPSQSSLL